MRILFVTNFYLTRGSGGEEESCRHVVAGLRQRGHATLVVTSMHGTNNVPTEANGVCQSLYLEMDLVPWRNSFTFFFQRRTREKHNLECLVRAIDQFEPDVIFFWGMWNLPRSLPALAEASYPGKVVYRFATYWPTLPSQHELYWRTTGRKWYSRIVKRVVGSVALAMLAREGHQPELKFERAMCVSVATRSTLVKAGIPVTHARIIYTGLDAGPFLQRDVGQPRHDTRDIRLLYVGRLSHDKGLDTAIMALSSLVGQGRRDLRLSVAGSGSPEYESHLCHLVKQVGLTDYVSFLGWVPADEVPDLMRAGDFLLVPSVWPEPFARSVLEGMASGLVVIAASTGGTPEIISNGENGLLFAPGKADDLAHNIAWMADNADLRRAIAQAGRRTVLERFTATMMLDEIEAFLMERPLAPSASDFHPGMRLGHPNA
jgi:glycosyltransferase involved in cell wall biosynthesis